MNVKINTFSAQRVMDFFLVISAVANLLTALSVTAHFVHSFWKCRTLSGSGRPPCMEGTRDGGSPRTGEEVRGSVLHDLECVVDTPGSGACTPEGSEDKVRS